MLNLIKSEVGNTAQRWSWVTSNVSYCHIMQTSRHSIFKSNAILILLYFGKRGGVKRGGGC